ncbi:hypothetical protein [Burkholderia latens]|jgi:hypothetical protein|uniref:hypothetical protein n=1 Tax=Burkholderia latens TaxID=488446 RepID=UPI00158AA8FE|nr:hypothetical protein [Burkholderia latens]
MLDERQRITLMYAARCGIRAIDGAIDVLKDENPNAFHTTSTLASRVFYHKPPDHTPCGGFIHAEAEDRRPN